MSTRAHAPEKTDARPTAPFRPMIPEGAVAAQRWVRRKPAGQGEAASAPAHAVHRTDGDGQPLDPSLRRWFEPRLDVDLGAVRLHRGPAAEDSARAMGALAYTVGDNVVFGANQYAPETTAGRRLLAHELVHVAQQRGEAVASPAALRIGPAGDAHEQEADRLADVLARADVPGVRPKIEAAPHGIVQRQQAPACVPAPAQCEAPKEDAAPQCVAPEQPGQEQAQPAQEPAPPPAGQTIYFEGVPLAPDPSHLRRQLERVVVEKGEAGASAFASRFLTMEVLQRAMLEAQYGRELVDSIRAALREAIDQLERDDKAFIQSFEDAAKAATLEILEHSRQQIEAELDHYGIRDGVGPDNDGAEGAGPVGGPNRAAIAGLQGAARRLAGKRRVTDAAARASIVSREEAERAARANPFLVPQDLTEAAERDRKAWQHEEEDYKKLADQLAAEFSVLAAYSTGPDAAGRLEALASMPPRQAAESVGQEARERLANIETVQKELGGRFNIWTQSQIVRITLQQKSATPAQRRVVNDHAVEVKADADSSKMLFAAVAIGLGLLAAIPTGGSSLLAGVAAAATIVGAGLTVYSTYEHIQDYALESAATGTDFDKARAISHDEPSLMWLALDVVAAVADVYGAAKAFKALKEVIVAAKASKLAKLPEVIDAARKAGLSSAAQGRVIAEVVGTGGGAAEVKRTLQIIADTFMRLEPTTGADVMLARGFQSAAAKVLEEGRVLAVPAERSGILAQLRRLVLSRGVPEAKVNELVSELVKELNKPSIAGFYHRNLEIILVKGNASAGDVASVLAHELAHETQALEKLRRLEKYEREFQAYVAQRQFLSMLPADLAPEHAWLRAATDAEIEAHIVDAYRLEAVKPARFDSEALGEQILSLIRKRGK